jgi:hypothetical protein
MLFGALYVLLHFFVDRQVVLAGVLEVSVLGDVLDNDRRVVSERIDGISDKLLILIDAVMQEPLVLHEFDHPCPASSKCIGSNAETSSINRLTDNPLLDGFE